MSGSGQSAKRSHLAGALLALLLAVVLCAQSAPARAQATPVAVQPERGVAADVAAEFRRAADLTIQFFRETHAIDLTRQVRVLLVADAPAYTSAMMREWSISQAEAERRVRTTWAWTSGTIIIVNTDRTRTGRARAFIVAHELTHQFQIQVSTSALAWSLYWLTEGMADIIGIQVAELAGLSSLAEGRQSVLETLRRAPARPDLGVIDTQPKWFAALEVYGAGVTYGMAAMAVLYLTEKRGHRALMDFFRALRETQDRAQAFRQAFDTTIEDFSAEFRAHLAVLFQ